MPEIQKKRFSLSFSTLLTTLLTFSFLFFTNAIAWAGEVTLAWDASSSSNVAGYNLHYGQASRNYTSTVKVGNSTTHKVSGLQDGKTYYFAATAYDTTGTVASGYSNEVNKIIPVSAVAPVANFSASSTSGTAPLIVNFSDASTGVIDTRSWNFGDGGTSTAQTAVYTYQTAGTFTVKLTVTGPGGTNTQTKTNYITVSANTSGGSTGGDSTGGNTGGGTGGNSGGSGTVPGLVAAYGFEESGDVWVQDASGNANEGLIEGATRTSSNQGRFGRALAFDGINDWITVNDDSSLDLTDGMTLEAWLYPTESMYSWRTAFMKERGYGLAYSLCANSDANSPSTAVRINSSDRNLKGGPALPSNQWTHLAATYDGTTQRLYVNGSQVASQSVSGSIQVSDGVLRIGGTSVWTQFFKGRIDEVRIYNRALTADQIKNDMTTPVVK